MWKAACARAEPEGLAPFPMRNRGLLAALPLETISERQLALPAVPEQRAGDLEEPEVVL